jgi:prepilin-type N-terminal cleavage/methylation domain-containing protein
MNPSEHRRRRAFTIPEMLAVVAIIVIIISILLPALGKARKSAYIAVCASNEHQIGMAQQGYLVDSRNVYPVLYNWGDLVGQRGQTGFYSSSTLNVKVRPLDRYLDANQDNMDVQVARCPADLGDSLNGSVPNAFDAYGTSYLPQWAGDVFRVRYVYGVQGDPSRPSMKKWDITRASNKLLLADWPWHGNRVTSDRQTHWHSNGYERQFNTLFADIHVEFFTYPAAEIDVNITGTYSPAPPNPNHTYW